MTSALKPTETYGYDAAGNRGDAVVDNLNRATSLGGQAVANDVLGNRLSLNGNVYAWDCLNRLTSQRGGVFAYAYRADGMRVRKVNGSESWSYRHDGQTVVEDMDLQYGQVKSLTRYGLGARGVDLVETTKAGATTTAFPLYDAHGNQAARLSRSGTGYQVSERVSLDAWGLARQQQTGADKRMRYCASLGHQMDEYGLVYMRARYYAPDCGRFVSEDPARDGGNWFAYCSNDPGNRVDRNGREDLSSFLVSNSLSEGLEGVGVRTLTGSIEAVEDCLMVNVSMFEGSPQCTIGAVNLIRQWAVGKGIESIFISGTVGSMEGRGTVILALQAINTAGSKGALLTSNPLTQIFWLLADE